MTAYKAHHAYIAPARMTADLPRLVIGVIAIEMIYGFSLNFIDSVLVALPDSAVAGYYDGSTQAGLMAQLLSFGFLALSVFVVARFLNNRTPQTLIGDRRHATNATVRATLACCAVFLLIELLPPYWSSDGMDMRNIALWLALAPVAVLALLIQTAAEELFYRGYIQQQLAARFATPAVWLIVPNLLFATAHWSGGTDFNDSVGYVIWAFFFGLAASDLTARTGNLGAAIGFHLANNAYAFLLFAEKGAADSGLALFLFTLPLDLLLPNGESAPIINAGLVVELLTLLVMWLAVRIAIRR